MAIAKDDESALRNMLERSKKWKPSKANAKKLFEALGRTGEEHSALRDAVLDVLFDKRWAAFAETCIEEGLLPGGFLNEAPLARSILLRLAPLCEGIPRTESPFQHHGEALRMWECLKKTVEASCSVLDEEDAKLVVGAFESVRDSMSDTQRSRFTDSVSKVLSQNALAKDVSPAAGEIFIDRMIARSGAWSLCSFFSSLPAEHPSRRRVFARIAALESSSPSGVRRHLFLENAFFGRVFLTNDEYVVAAPKDGAEATEFLESSMGMCVDDKIVDEAKLSAALRLVERDFSALPCEKAEVAWTAFWRYCRVVSEERKDAFFKNGASSPEMCRRVLEIAGGRALEDGPNARDILGKTLFDHAFRTCASEGGPNAAFLVTKNIFNASILSHWKISCNGTEEKNEPAEAELRLAERMADGGDEGKYRLCAAGAVRSPFLHLQQAFPSMSEGAKKRVLERMVAHTRMHGDTDPEKSFLRHLVVSKKPEELDDAAGPLLPTILRTAMELSDMRSRDGVVFVRTCAQKYPHLKDSVMTTALEQLARDVDRFGSGHGSCSELSEFALDAMVNRPDAVKRTGVRDILVSMLKANAKRTLAGYAHSTNAENIEEYMRICATVSGDDSPLRLQTRDCERLANNICDALYAHPETAAAAAAFLSCRGSAVLEDVRPSSAAEMAESFEKAGAKKLLENAVVESFQRGGVQIFNTWYHFAEAMAKTAVEREMLRGVKQGPSLSARILMLSENSFGHEEEVLKSAVEADPKTICEAFLFAANSARAPLSADFGVVRLLNAKDEAGTLRADILDAKDANTEIFMRCAARAVLRLLENTGGEHAGEAKRAAASWGSVFAERLEDMELSARIAAARAADDMRTEADFRGGWEDEPSL